MKNVQTSRYNDQRCYVYNKAFARFLIIIADMPQYLKLAELYARSTRCKTKVL